MNIPSWAKVGAKVVCVDDTYDTTGRGKEVLITAGAVYTITSISHPFLRLQELPPGRGGFRWYRFRPLISKTLSEDVALFAPLLERKRKTRVAAKPLMGLSEGGESK